MARRTLQWSCVVALSLTAVSAAELGAQQQAGMPQLPPELASVRAALDMYQDPMVAVRDGYFSTVACMDFPKGGKDAEVIFAPGAMGVHFLNTANIGPTVDAAKPQVLIYEPVGDKLRLVAAEWFVPVDLAKERPRLFDQDLVGPMEGHEPIMPKTLRHYDLHVWLWKQNPAGMFATTNAAVKCPKSGYTHAEPGTGDHKHP